MENHSDVLDKLGLLRAQGEGFTFENFATFGTGVYPISFKGSFATWRTRLDNLIRTTFANSSGVVQRLATGLGVQVLGNSKDDFVHMMSELLATIDEARTVLVEDTFGELSASQRLGGEPAPTSDARVGDGGATVYGDRWEVINRLGQGGQAQTFVVRDRRSQTNAEFVLKRFHDIDRAPRFKTEVAALEQAKHGGVVALVDHDLSSSEPYIVMEYCRGGSLEDAIGRLPKDVGRLLEMMADVCDGVAAAHARGITHRDIKPANILLRTEYGGIVVGDFGIAFISDGERQTLTNEAVGARRFTAPELADGRSADVGPRSDVYSIGKLIYWALAGGRVFDREQHRMPSYDLARRDGGNQLFEHVNRLLDQMIVLNPQERFADAAQAGVAIREVARMLNAGTRVLAPDLAQRCDFCGFGEYVNVDLSDPTHVENFGLKPIPGGGRWRALVCSSCGNLQLFRPERTTSGEWWGPDRGAPAIS